MDRRKQIEKWLARRRRLGLTYAELSKETGLAANTLAHWAWRLRREGRPLTRARRSRKREADFVELRSAPTSRERSSGALEVTLGGSRTLRIPLSLDDEELARVLRALDRC
jgi:hypothetical protein